MGAGFCYRACGRENVWDVSMMPVRAAAAAAACSRGGILLCCYFHLVFITNFHVPWSMSCVCSCSLANCPGPLSRRMRECLVSSSGWSPCFSPHFLSCTAALRPRTDEHGCPKRSLVTGRWPTFAALDCSAKVPYQFAQNMRVSLNGTPLELQRVRIR